MDDLSRSLVRRTMQSLLACKVRTDLDRSPFVFFQILPLFGIFQEYEDVTLANDWQPHKDKLISYIHQYIYNPEKIQIKNLVQTFHISTNYFSVYFKNNFGISYREYLNNYRLKLIESWVKNGFTLKQIADEFGFADESHMSHFFKRQSGSTVSQFRLNAKIPLTTN